MDTHRSNGVLNRRGAREMTLGRRPSNHAVTRSFVSLPLVVFAGTTATLSRLATLRFACSLMRSLHRSFLQARLRAPGRQFWFTMVNWGR